MSQSLRTNAIVLRRTNYGEADRILLILTPNNGKISVMARGVRKEKSRLAGGVELFAVCEMTMVKGSNNSGDLWTLTGSKLNTFFDHIMSDYDRLQFGYESIKSISTASENLNDDAFFELLHKNFLSLNNLNINLKIVQTWFYLRLAGILGEGLNTATDNNGMNLVEDARYDFNAYDRVFSFRENGEFGADELKVLRLLSVNDPEIVARISGINEIIEHCLFVARSVAKL